MNLGTPAENSLTRFARATRNALAAFDREIDPLHLPDDAYQAAAHESGLRAVLDLAEQMAETLSSLADRT
ncbi:MAG: hypothetical protein ACYDH6_16105 [Acidimicrobiales bacterium]